MRRHPAARWAKSWHTPRRPSSTADSGVETSVNVGSYSNVSWMSWHSARAPSTIGRCGVNASSAIVRSAAPCSPSGTYGELPTNGRTASASPPRSSRDAASAATSHGSPGGGTLRGSHDDLALGVQRQRRRGVVHADLQDAVAEHVDALGALVGRRGRP